VKHPSSHPASQPSTHSSIHSLNQQIFAQWALVAHAYNPSYSGGRDQENCGSQPALVKQFTRPYLEKTHHKKGLVEWLT
jgi:hypothetical protein